MVAVEAVGTIVVCVRTAIVSDLHLGLGSGADLLRRERFRELLLEQLDGTDRLILLGDVLELRDRPLAEVLAATETVMAALGEALAGREIVIVPGNHDHHLIEGWLHRRSLTGPLDLALEQTGKPAGTAFKALAAQAEPASVRFAYPGIWVREDIYATHGHYLDRHLTVPTVERLGVALVERVLGIPGGGPDPLAPADDPDLSVAEYERVQTPVYALLFALAQATVGDRRSGADPSARIWQMLSGGETRTAKVRSWLLGAVAVPGAVGVANRLGLGPVSSDLSATAIGRAGFEAMTEVVERLAIRAEHLIFGHTHHRGVPREQTKVALWNTGSWVHSPSLLGETAARSPYWPGTICFVEDEGDPELVHSLDELSRDQLAEE
jgi:predicted phosphodiesterase